MLSKTTSLPTIVVRLPNWVGDVCMVMPCLAWLSTSGCPLVICGKPFAKAFIDSLIGEDPQSEFIALTGSIIPDARTIRQSLAHRRAMTGRHEKLSGLLFPDSLTSALTFRLAGIPCLGHRDDGRSLLLRWPVNKSDSKQHAVLRWYRLARIAAKEWRLPIPSPFPDKPPAYYYTPPTQAIQRVQECLTSHDLNQRPIVLIAPTATGLHQGKRKVWPGFAQLTDALIARGYAVITCPPAHEQDQARKAAPRAMLLEALPLDAFAQLTRVASIVICNDSGVSHIAALTGASQITLFGVTDPALTGPWSDKAICLGAMDDWPSVDAVLDACAEQLGIQPGIPHRPQNDEQSPCSSIGN
ncbi:glycosyltransferase family 9 protein [Orrella marina]|uniref:Heptosyltransferase n=1 Tax=Orrella marina TaxID=2163011 RepID=A0A2R4XG20_9BURK|nr:glycosyltransferase family 9 protein [Orrella marina]AWB32633.1 heptosyltransferase [Orrella marina]